MRCIVIGAGNAGRPAAKILNYTGTDVVVTDQKSIDDFPDDVKTILFKMEESGIELRLGSDSLQNFSDFDLAYISPTVPENSPIKKQLIEYNIKIVNKRELPLVIKKSVSMLKMKIFP